MPIVRAAAVALASSCPKAVLASEPIVMNAAAAANDLVIESLFEKGNQ